MTTFAGSFFSQNFLQFSLLGRMKQELFMGIIRISWSYGERKG